MRLNRNLIGKAIAVLTTLLIITAFVKFSFADTQTHNTVPSADANFITDTQTFLEDESAERAQQSIYNVILSGGIGATDASLTHTVSACIGYPYGYYVSQASVSHTYTASKDTFVYLRHDDSSTESMGGASMTYDGHFVFAEKANSSDLPTDANIGWLPLMEVVTDGTSITTVNDLRSGEIPLEAFDSFSDAVDAAANRTIVIAAPFRLTSNKTVASTITLHFLRNAVMTIDSGVTLTLEGSIIAGNYPIFAGSGAVDVSGYSGGKLLIDWGSNMIYSVEGTVIVSWLDGKPVRNVIANNSNGNPNMSDVVFDVDNDLAEGAWESIGPTLSSPDNAWTAMDSLPSDIDYIVIKVRGACASTSGAAGAEGVSVYARSGDGAQAVGGDNRIFYAIDKDASSETSAGGISPYVPIPVNSDLHFDAYWESDFTTTNSIDFYLIGYGYNQ